MAKIKPKEILIPVAVLCSIALICGALLGGFYLLTLTDDNAETMKAVSENYPNLVLLEQQADYSAVIDAVNSELSDKGKLLSVFLCEDGTYVFRSSGKGGYGGDVVLLIPVTDGAIGEIVVFENSETAGVGSNALPPKKTYIGQYEGVKISDIDSGSFRFSEGKAAGSAYSWFDGSGSGGGAAMSSPDGSVVALTGATKTSTAVLNSVNIAVCAYLKLSEVQDG